MISRITELRNTLAAAVQHLLREGETVSVSPAPSEYERGLERLAFAVTVTVGPVRSEGAEERLDELLSGAVKGALEGADCRPQVTKSSGYQSLIAPDGEQLLGATFTAQVVN